MDHDTAVEVALELQANWKYWHDLDRAASVVRLVDYGCSKRGLAKLLGCIEGLIRHIEIVGRLPLRWKQYLMEGHSTRKVVAAWRAQRSH